MYDRCLGPDTYVTIDVNNCCQGPVHKVLSVAGGRVNVNKWMCITVAWDRLHKFMFVAWGRMYMLMYEACIAAAEGWVHIEW